MTITYTLGNTSTQLTHRLGFEPTVIHARATFPVWLPPVPANWQALHHPGLVDALEQRMHNIMACPVETQYASDGVRHLQVMGGFIYEIARTGRVSCYAWTQDERQVWSLERRKESTVVAEGGPFESRWTLPLGQSLRRILHAHHPNQALDVRQYIDWLLEQMVAWHWTPQKAAVVRAHVKDELALQPKVLAHLRAIFAGATGRNPRMADYNRALLRQQEDARLLVEAPQLLPLYALIEQDLAPEGARPAVMKEYLLAQGIKPVTWRLLHQHGTAWMQEFMPYFEASVSGPQRAANLVHLVQLFGFRQGLHLPLMHRLMQLRENPNSPVRSADLWDEDSALGRLMLRLGLLYEQGQATDRALLLDKIYHFAHWADKHQPSAAWLQQCSVAALLRHLLTDQAHVQAVLEHSRHWRIDLDVSWPDEKFEIVFFDSALDIWKEGQTMQHCAANYIEACVQGHEIMASVRPRAGGKPLVTISYQLADEQVTVVRMSGFANSTPPQDVQAMAAEVAQAITEQWQHCEVWQQALA